MHNKTKWPSLPVCGVSCFEISLFSGCTESTVSELVEPLHGSSGQATVQQ